MTETVSTTHDIQAVPARLVSEIWPGVVDLIAQAAERWPQDRSADDYLAACRCAHAQLWLVSRGAKLRAVILTEVVNFPRQRVAVIELMSGDGLEDWAAEVDAELTRWAQALGCARLRTGGRKGLTKAAARLGYKMTAVLMEKDLSDARR